MEDQGRMGGWKPKTKISSIHSFLLFMFVAFYSLLSFNWFLLFYFYFIFSHRFWFHPSFDIFKWLSCFDSQVDIVLSLSRSLFTKCGCHFLIDFLRLSLVTRNKEKVLLFRRMYSNNLCASTRTTIDCLILLFNFRFVFGLLPSGSFLLLPRLRCPVFRFSIDFSYP